MEFAMISQPGEVERDSRSPRTATPPHDPGLLERVRAGDEEALQVLARDYRRSAYQFALQLLGTRQDAMDVAQDSMLRLFENIDRIDASRPVRPWLFSIVRNLVRDLARRRRVRPTDALDEGQLTGQLIDGEQDPERVAAQRELRERVWRCLERLDETKREILVLRDYHDLKYKEIAEVLQIPDGTVMSRLRAARKALRAEFHRDSDRGDTHDRPM